MTPEAIRDTIRRVLHTVAPEADLDGLAPGADLRSTLDIDSMDFLKFITGLHAALGVDVPESDYRRLGTLDACVMYLTAHAPAARPP